MKEESQGRRRCLNSQRKSKVVIIADPLHPVPTYHVSQSSCPQSTSDKIVVVPYMELSTRGNFKNKCLFKSFDIKEASVPV